MTLAAAATVLLALWVVGHLYSRSVERRVNSRFARDGSGIIVGAEDVVLPGRNGAAVLLVHGAGDTPQTLRHVADELNRRGYEVLAPLLPGHGRSLAELARHSSAEEWYGEVRARYGQLRVRHDWVGVSGLSMGGALSARLAADFHEIPALALAAPYLVMPMAESLVTNASWVWGPFMPYISTTSSASVLDPAASAQSLGYGAMSASAIRALRTTARNGWSALPEIRAPTLVIQSRGDNRVSANDTRRAFELLGASDKSLDWIDGAGHVLTVDYGWQHVSALIADWMDGHRN